jgi:hypothetical protein
MAGSSGWQPEERNDGQQQGARRQSSRRRSEDTLAGQEPVTGKWTKRDDKSGKFIDQKADSKPFKGVRKEKYAAAR